jgi:hypothetical protein
MAGLVGPEHPLVQPVALADRILAGLDRASYETVHGNGHVAGDKAHED